MQLQGSRACQSAKMNIFFAKVWQEKRIYELLNESVQEFSKTEHWLS